MMPGVLQSARSTSQLIELLLHARPLVFVCADRERRIGYRKVFEDVGPQFGRNIIKVVFAEFVEKLGVSGIAEPVFARRCLSASVTVGVDQAERVAVCLL